VGFPDHPSLSGNSERRKVLYPHYPGISPFHSRRQSVGWLQYAISRTKKATAAGPPRASLLRSPMRRRAFRNAIARTILPPSAWPIVAGRTSPATTITSETTVPRSGTGRPPNRSCQRKRLQEVLPGRNSYRDSHGRLRQRPRKRTIWKSSASSRLSSTTSTPREIPERLSFPILAALPGEMTVIPPTTTADTNQLMSAVRQKSETGFESPIYARAPTGSAINKLPFHTERHDSQASPPPCGSRQFSRGMGCTCDGLHGCPAHQRRRHSKRKVAPEPPAAK